MYVYIHREVGREGRRGREEGRKRDKANIKIFTFRILGYVHEECIRKEVFSLMEGLTGFPVLMLLTVHTAKLW